MLIISPTTILTVHCKSNIYPGFAIEKPVIKVYLEHFFNA